MNRDTDHPSFGVRGPRNAERHLRLVEPPQHADPCGNAVAGAAVAVVVLGCAAALLWLALRWTP